MRQGYLLLIIFCFSFNSYAINRVAVANAGDGWSVASNWSPAGVPQDGDTAIIPAGFTLRVKGSTYPPVFPGVFIQVYGTLDFDPSGKIDLSASGVVNIQLGGIITSNGSSSEMIRINGVIKFSGSLDGTMVGPSNASAATGASPLGFSPGLLPVKILSFNATRINNQVALKWVTSQEINFSRFELERSNGRDPWTVIATINGRGNSFGMTTYTASDTNPISGINIYRLKSIDRDESYEYSKTISLQLDKQNSFIKIGPNPATSFVSISIDTDLSLPAVIKIINQKSEVVKKLNIVSNINTIRIDLYGLSKGVYALVIEDAGTFRQSSQILVK